MKMEPKNMKDQQNSSGWLKSRPPKVRLLTCYLSLLASAEAKSRLVHP